jgi:hypothetical protein
MHRVFRTVFLLAAAIAACTAGVLSESTPKSDSNRDLLLVVNKGDQTLGIVEPESGLQLATVPVEDTTGHEVAASPDGRTAWIPIYGNSGVGSPGADEEQSRGRIFTHTRIATTDLGHPARPHCAVFGPKMAGFT